MHVAMRTSLASSSSPSTGMAAARSSSVISPTYIATNWMPCRCTSRRMRFSNRSPRRCVVRSQPASTQRFFASSQKRENSERSTGNCVHSRGMAMPIESGVRSSVIMGTLRCGRNDPDVWGSTDLLGDIHHLEPRRRADQRTVTTPAARGRAEPIPGERPGTCWRSALRASPVNRAAEPLSPRSPTTRVRRR